jgi:polysaccharide biosynthesis protein PslH
MSTTTHRVARLRILLLLPFPPRLDAVHGGGRAMAQLLVRLAQRHDLALLYLRAADDPPLDETLSVRCVRAEEVRSLGRTSGLARLRKWGWILRTTLGGQPKWVGHCNYESFRNSLRRLLSEWRPDVVQAEYHVMGQYFDIVDLAVPCILNQHEPGTSAARDRWRVSRGPSRLAARVELALWDRYERSIIRRSDAVVVFTEKDRGDLPGPPGYRIERIPIGTDLPDEPADPAEADDRTLLFVGNYIHPPNVDAAVHLAREILPKVREHLPDARLLLVGNGPPPAVEKLADSNVQVTGHVPDVTPYLETAAVVLVPLRLGGGMRVKVMEALGAGKPVVASSLAVAGMPLVDGKHALIRDDADSFAAATVECLRSREYRLRLGAGARQWAQENLGWEASVESFESLYRSLLEPRPPACIPSVSEPAT